MATGRASTKSTDQSSPSSPLASHQPLHQPLPSQQQHGHANDPENQSSARHNVDHTTLKSLGKSVGLQRVRRILDLGLNEFQLKLNANLRKRLLKEFQLWISKSKETAENNVRNAKQLSNQRWLLDEINTQTNRAGSQAPRFVCDFMLFFINKQLKELTKLKMLEKQFRRNVVTATTEKVRREIILHFAECLNPDKRSLAKDENAFARWFDEEALSDRFLKRQGEEEMMLCFSLDRLAAAIDHVFHRAKEFNLIRFGGAMADLRKRIKGIWQRLNVESSLLPALVYEGDVRIHVAAIKSLRVMLQDLPSDVALEILSPTTLGFVDRAARQKTSDVWIQCEALTILSNLSIDAAINVIDQRLSNPGKADDIFVRQHAWGLIETFLERGDGHGVKLKWEDDSSSFVRQKMADALFLSYDRFAHRRWRQIVLGDIDPKVRASAIATATKPGLHARQSLSFFRIIPHVLKSEDDEFVLRTALWSVTKVLTRAMEKLSAQTNGDPSQTQFTILMLFRTQIQPAISKLQNTHPSIPVRRWASQCNERIWGQLNEEIAPLLKRVREDVSKIKPGRSRIYPLQWFDWIDDITLTRMFAVLSQDDFGFEIQKTWRGLRVSRGPVFGFRLWRMFYEIRRSTTDKRQGHRHMIGRVSTANLKAPSQILGELSETKVPGEPLNIASDSTWRPFLPLVDDLISVLNMSWFKPQTVQIVSSQGVTKIMPPQNLRQRISACAALTKNFSKYASLRNSNGDTTNANSYVRSIRELGFEVSFTHHQYEAEETEKSERQRAGIADTSVSEFFNAVTQTSPLSLPFATHLLGASHYETAITQAKRFAEYFSSIYENSLNELVMFSFVVMMLVILKHVWMNFTFRRSRNSIPLSIGGWGTRGKSGTERLKAALLGVMGHGLVSKTTGCEAMFIHAYPFGQPLEIPFFRPYDKATIWEQRNLVNIAAKLRPSVFLWECMALNPEYVNVLQHQWMQDDIATITNTYPDHEDVQGPAGYNVAETIAGFVPKRSVLVTTEEQMKPYVTQQAKRSQTTLQSVGWLESGLITHDILERFPYQEHPDNIALVSRMASNLGLTHEQSVKGMADDLVPDLGVLKTHPIAKVNTRQIEFTNGMSANERFGCMGNWKRLHFDTQDPWAESTTWIVGVINNRADRVPRSKVFAKIIVDDVDADRFFLIGTNLNGLKKFIDEAWQEKNATSTLKKTDGSWEKEAALAKLKRSAWKYRQVIDASHIVSQLKSMILSAIEDAIDQGHSAPVIDMGNISPTTDIKALFDDTEIPFDHCEDIIKQQQWLNRSYAEYRELLETIEDAPEEISDTIDQKYRTMLSRWFSRKFVTIQDAEATGEAVVRRIVEEIPPGFLARTMGMQNIKGTGLDFVYRFHAWDICYEACEATQDRRVEVAEKAIAALTTMPVIGMLCVEKINETIRLCRTSRMLQRVDLQSQLDVLESRVKEAVAKTATSSSQGYANAKNAPTAVRRNLATLHQWSIQWAEEFLDVNDSIRRREKAELIYREYVACRISRQRAVIELRKLNKRQKGGWLKEDSRKVRNKLLMKSN